MLVLNRKSMRVLYGSPDGQAWNIPYVKNTGTSNINPVINGFKYRDEAEEHKFQLRHLFINTHLEPEHHWPLTFAQDDGNPPINPDISRLEYFFARDNEGRTKRLFFNNGKPVSRFPNWIMEWLC